MRNNLQSVYDRLFGIAEFRLGFHAHGYLYGNQV